MKLSTCEENKDLFLSFCDKCSGFIGASKSAEVLAAAELAHVCKVESGKPSEEPESPERQQEPEALRREYQQLLKEISRCRFRALLAIAFLNQLHSPKADNLRLSNQGLALYAARVRSQLLSLAE